MRSVAGIALGTAAVPELAWCASQTEASKLPAPDPTPRSKRYRAVSWWLTWEDLAWPNAELMDKIRRRADTCAASGVNCCLIFGAHFRWDFMPVWARLHDQLHFIADELHQRQIQLFDHHSSVLTHRPRNRDEALSITRRNRHHIPFYPSSEEAAAWTFNGSRLNDWRMRDVESGDPVYLPSYNAEQYCMNNPAFKAAYARYIQQLRNDTGIDGLMSDDGIFYADWQACGCEHCRARFQREYGHTLPPVGDANFWGNRASAAFRDWIEMRFRTSGDFLAELKQVLPAGFPLLTCCASSESQVLPAYGMSYQDFILNCNHVLLEMTGSTPTPAGTWDDRIPSQLLHLSIARDHAVPCLGLGYGFFPDTAFFIWAVNKFLGSDSWFSTLKGRLNASPAELAALADDPDLVGEGYRWEKTHADLFTGEVNTDVAVFFSRVTRDFHGQVPADYVDDYCASCLKLTRAGLSCEVATEMPAFGRIRCLVLSSVNCLSTAQKASLTAFLNEGGTVIATGPTGHHDERANPIPKPWLENFGFVLELKEPERPGGFPPYKKFKSPVEIAQCRVRQSPSDVPPDGWWKIRVGKGQLIWRPERITHRGIGEEIIPMLQDREHNLVRIRGLPPTWRLRQYRDGNRILIHALPGKVEALLHPTLRNHFISQPIVEKLRFESLDKKLTLEPPQPLKHVLLHSPDLKTPRKGQAGHARTWTLDPSPVGRYFIVECFV